MLTLSSNYIIKIHIGKYDYAGGKFKFSNQHH